MSGTPAREVARLLARRRAVAFTGAGISAESGIPTFRSGPGGLWDRYDPDEYATADAFHRDPGKVWELFFELHDVAAAAHPNPGHVALAELERMGLLDGVITQNVDALHRRAGSREVVEVHGAGDRVRCTRCGSLTPFEHTPRMYPPLCGCSGVLKADVILFGDMLPQAAWQKAMALAHQAATFLVIGTSGLVAPASYLPGIARGSGAALVVINPEPTPIDHEADHVLRGLAGEILPAILEETRRVLAEGGLG